MRLLTFILAFAYLTVDGQNKESPDLPFNLKNSIQFELGGQGMLYSFSYERLLFNGSRFKTMAQIGFAYYPPVLTMNELWFPVSLTEIYSISDHHIELGLGYSFSINIEYGDFIVSKPNGLFTGRIGYRYQKPTKRIFYRAAFTPLVEIDNDAYFYPSGALAIGYSF